MWSNARMDTNARERLAADILNWGFPRLFSVRWMDDESGWRSMQVLAANEDEALRIVQPIAGDVYVKAYRCAI